MTIAEQITRAKADYDAVYEAGKQAEQEKFWDDFQGGGTDNVDYSYRFYYWLNGDCYNPIYPIRTNRNSCKFTFYGASGITDTKVDIDMSNEKTTSIESMFHWCINLKTIRKLIVNEKITKYTNTFAQCKSLEHIIIEGVISDNIDFSACPLSVVSMKSVITHLMNLNGTGNEFSKTVKFSADCWNALEADSTSPSGGTWKDYVNNLGWNT